MEKRGTIGVVLAVGLAVSLVGNAYLLYAMNRRNAKRGAAVARLEKQIDRSRATQETLQSELEQTKSELKQAKAELKRAAPDGFDFVFKGGLLELVRKTDGEQQSGAQQSGNGNTNAPSLLTPEEQEELQRVLDELEAGTTGKQEEAPVGPSSQQKADQKREA